MLISAPGNLAWRCLCVSVRNGEGPLLVEKFSEFIIYVDESGDHSLVQVDPQYPIFVLAFCVFEKNVYANTISPAIQQFKFKYFGYDMVILHEHEIRKSKGDFDILLNPSIRNDFMEDLNQLIDGAPFTIVATGILKQRLNKVYTDPDNPYHLALRSCLEQAHILLDSRGQEGRVTHVVFERRGKKEDDDLELAFRRACDGKHFRGESPPVPHRLC